MRLRIVVTTFLAALILIHCSKSQKSASPATLNFSVPSDWILEEPGAGNPQARYKLPHAAGDSEDAELTITASTDENAPIQKIIDDWNAQFKKPDGNAALCQMTRREVNGVPLTVLDTRGTYIAGKMAKSGFRMLAAIAETEHGPWLFRLIGPVNTVSVWELSFESFLETIG